MLPERGKHPEEGPERVLWKQMPKVGLGRSDRHLYRITAVQMNAQEEEEWYVTTPEQIDESQKQHVPLPMGADEVCRVCTLFCRLDVTTSIEEHQGIGSITTRTKAQATEDTRGRGTYARRLGTK